MLKRISRSSPVADLPVSDLRYIPHARSSSRPRRSQKRSKNQRFDRLRFDVGAGSQRPRPANRRSTDPRTSCLHEGDDWYPRNELNGRMNPTAQMLPRAVDRYLEHNTASQNNRQIQPSHRFAQHNLWKSEAEHHESFDESDAIALPFSLNPHNPKARVKHITSDLEEEKEHVLQAGFAFVHQVSEHAQTSPNYRLAQHRHDSSDRLLIQENCAPRPSSVIRDELSYGRAENHYSSSIYEGTQMANSIADLASDFQFTKTPAKAYYSDFAQGKKALRTTTELRQLSNDEIELLSVPKVDADYSSDNIHVPRAKGRDSQQFASLADPFGAMVFCDEVPEVPEQNPDCRQEIYDTNTDGSKLNHIPRTNKSNTPVLSKPITPLSEYKCQVNADQSHCKSRRATAIGPFQNNYELDHSISDDELA